MKYPMKPLMKCSLALLLIFVLLGICMTVQYSKITNCSYITLRKSGNPQNTGLEIVVDDPEEMAQILDMIPKSELYLPKLPDLFGRKGWVYRYQIHDSDSRILKENTIRVGHPVYETVSQYFD